MIGLLNPDHWTEVFQALRRNKLRTFLTACGVFWGVLMLVVMLGFGNGLEGAVLRDFRQFAMNVIGVWGERTVKPYAGHKPGRRIRLTLEDVEAVKAKIPGVETVVSINYDSRRGESNRITRKNKTESFGVQGTEPEHQHLETIDLAAGRFLNPLDLAEQRKVAVIGERVRDAMFEKDENAIGQALKVGNIDFTVIGVYRTIGSGGRAEWMAGRVFVPRSTFARAFATGNRVDQFMVMIPPGRQSEEVQQQVMTLLRQRHAVHPEDTRAIEGFNRDKGAQKFRNLFYGISALTWIVGVLTLLAGAIGVSNIMMIAVAERTKEIGIRKAIGATPLSIMVQIVTEATVLTGMAGYLGLCAGVGVVELAGRIVDALPKGDGPSMFSRPEIDLGKALIAAVILTVSGALAGLAPARTAVSVRPVEALAHE